MDVSRLDMERSIAYCRVALCVVIAVVLYVDPLTGGAFALGRYWGSVLAAHFVYSLALLELHRRAPSPRLASVAAVGDVVFAAAVATVTEGTTSPFYAFFAFAVLAVALRSGLRAALLVTTVNVSLYIAFVVLRAPGDQHLYLFIRAAYVAITGYMVGYFGEIRLRQETRLRELEAVAERERIARSLHDGHMQALAGVNLRLETCRELLRRGEHDEAVAELTDLQRGVNREHDELRAYIRSLVDKRPAAPAAGEAATRVSVNARFEGSAGFVEHVLLLMLEGTRNVHRHAQARAAEVEARVAAGELLLTIDDDGVGFGEPGTPSWTMRSRVEECGGSLRLAADGRAGGHVVVQLPVG
jgi:signal transduction histidine kinase